MEVVQSLNQNALLVIDEFGKEIVALGRGIGFNKKKGDLIDSAKISRVFVVKSDEQEKLRESINSVDNEIFSIAEDVVNMAESQLNKK